MDSRLELTDKQKSLIKKLADVFEELQKEKVGIVSQQDRFTFDGFRFYNASEVISTDIYEYDCYSNKSIEGYSSESTNSGEDAEEGQIWYTPNPNELDFLEVNVDQCYSSDFAFSVLLEKNEEMETFNKKRDKAQKLVPLMEKKEKLEKKIKRHVEGLNDAEDNLHMLEEKGLPQEIIDEEKAKIESTRKDLDKLNGELKELNAEIKKVKAIKTK